MRSLPILLLAGASLGGVPASAASEEPASRAFFHEQVLANGLRVLIAECTGSGLLASTVFISAGSIRETEGLNGAAHFLEHLLFNGTTTRTQEELYADVDRIGAYNNASTREDYAVFMFVADVNDAEKALSIQSDMLFHSTLPPEKFEKERGIVMEEIAKDRSSAGYEASLATKRLLYAGTPYELPVLGTEETIRGLERGRVWEYYKRYYVPSNMTLLLMGDFDREAMMLVVEKTFGAEPAAPHPEAPHALPALEGFQRVVAPLADEQRRVLVRLAAPPPGHPDFPAMELLSDVLGGGEGSRLSRALEREPALPTQGVSAGIGRLGQQTFLDVQADLDPGQDPSPVLERILGEIARLRAEKPGAEELAASRVSRRVEEARLREQIHYYAFMRSDVVSYAPAEFLNAQPSLYAKVTPEAIREAATRWLTGAEGLVLVTGPGLTPERGPVSPETLGFRVPEAALPAAGGFVVATATGPAPRAKEAKPAQTITLSEGPARGMRIIVSSDPSSDVLAFHVMAIGRSFVEPAGKEGISDFLHRLIARGADSWKRTDLHARLESIGATLKTCDAAFIPYDDYYTTPEFSFVRFETLDEFHAQAFELLGAMITAPRFDAEEIEAVRTEMAGLLAQREADPKQVMDVAVRSAIYGKDAAAARPITGTTESVAGITADDLRAWHARYFRPENLVVAVVTGLPAETVVAEVERTFRFAGSGQDEPRPIDLEPPLTTPGTAERRALGKPQARLGLSYTFDFDARDEAPLQAAALLLSDRMAFQLRERQGLAYDIGAGFRSWHGRRGLLSAVMGTRPENLGDAAGAMAAQIDSMKISRVSDETLAVAVNAYVGRARMQRITRMGQAYHLSMDVLRGERAGSGAERLQRLRGVQPSDVDRVAQRYFSSAQACRITVE